MLTDIHFNDMKHRKEFYFKLNECHLENNEFIRFSMWLKWVGEILNLFTYNMYNMFKIWILFIFNCSRLIQNNEQ